MGFVTPLALLALGAVGLPILAHLLRRRDLKVRALPTIKLLQRAEATSQRRVRVVDYVLLLVRILIVAALAFALAEPYLRVSLAYGDGSLASLVLVVDDSVSVTGREAVLEEARTRASEVVQSLPAGSEVAVVLAGTAPRVVVSRTSDLAAAQRAIDDITEGEGRGTDLPGALERAARELAGARHAERRVLVLSDLARHAGAADAPPMPSGVELAWEAVGQSAATGNAAIVGARATPDPTTPDMMSIAVEIAAGDELAGRSVDVTLEQAGEVLANQTVELSSPGTRLTLHAPVPEGDPGATVALALDDAIDADDRRGVLLRTRAGAQIVLVDGDPHPLRGSDEARFVARALDLAPANGGAISRRTVDPDTFASLPLDGVDVVVLANVPAPEGPVARRLTEHVEAGGGLLVAPGSNFDVRAYVASLGDLLPARPTIARAGDVGGPFLADGGGVSREASGLARARTRRRIGFEELAAEAETHMVFEDGAPALVRTPVGSGQVALLATTLDDDWTDLPFQPGFLPTVVDVTRRLSGAASASDVPVEAGRPIRLNLPAGTRELRVLGPAGVVLERSGDELDMTVEVERTERPGVYRAEVATEEHGLTAEPRLAFISAPPASEADLTPAEPPQNTGDTEDGGGSRGTVVRRPLTRWFFLTVGMLAVLEAVLRLRWPTPSST